jgi:hypothetical protein
MDDAPREAHKQQQMHARIAPLKNAKRRPQVLICIQRAAQTALYLYKATASGLLV